MGSLRTVQAFINGQTHNLSYNATTQKWEATITAPSSTSWNINAGHYYPVTVKAIDVAGNITQVNDSTSGTIGTACRLRVKEKDKPIVSILYPSNNGRVTTSKPKIKINMIDDFNGYIKDNMQLSSGEAEVPRLPDEPFFSNESSTLNPATFEVKIDGVKITTPTIVAGKASVITEFDCPITLSEGSHTITASIADCDGNVSDIASCAFKVDTIPPSLNVTNPTDNFITNNTAMTVSGTTDDSVSKPVTVTILVNNVDQGAVTVQSNGTFSKAIALSIGENTIVIKSQDIAGLSSTITRKVVVDTTPPQIKVVSVTPNPVDCGKTLTISVQVEDI